MKIEWAALHIGHSIIYRRELHASSLLFLCQRVRERELTIGAGYHRRILQDTPRRVFIVKSTISILSFPNIPLGRMKSQLHNMICNWFLCCTTYFWRKIKKNRAFLSFFRKNIWNDRFFAIPLYHKTKQQSFYCTQYKLKTQMIIKWFNKCPKWLFYWQLRIKDFNTNASFPIRPMWIS